MAIDFTYSNPQSTPNAWGTANALQGRAEEQAHADNLPRRGRAVPLGALLLAINQLAVTSRNGVDLADSLEMVSRNCKHPRLALQMANIHTCITEGCSLSTAISRYGDGFPAAISPMLAAAESSGNLPKTLKRITEMLRSEIQLRGTIISAMIYPAILISASTLVLLAMMLGVIPQFSKVFESLGKPIPASTQTLLWIGMTLRANWVWLLIGSGATLLAGISFRRHPVLTRPIHAMFMHGPMIREAYRPLMTGRNFRAIASMVAGGVPLLEAFRLARRATGDPYWQRMLDDVIENLLQGNRASEAMMQVDFLPAEAASLVATAEKTGRMAEVLEDVGLFYEEDASRRIKRLVAALEPAIIMVMGLLVAGIVMSVMLPLLDVTTIR